MKKLVLVFTLYIMFNCLSIPTMSFAQSEDAANVEMADTLRSEGKIYVVVLVIGIVFTGLLIYAVNTDRKLTRIEKEIQSLKSEQDS